TSIHKLLLEAAPNDVLAISQELCTDRKPFDVAARSAIGITRDSIARANKIDNEESMQLREPFRLCDIPGLLSIALHGPGCGTRLDADLGCTMGFECGHRDLGEAPLLALAAHSCYPLCVFSPEAGKYHS